MFHAHAYNVDLIIIDDDLNNTSSVYASAANSAKSTIRAISSFTEYLSLSFDQPQVIVLLIGSIDKKRQNRKNTHSVNGRIMKPIHKALEIYYIVSQ